MPIWKLTPTDVRSDDWGGSTHKGEIIVRAPTESDARTKAGLTFAKAQREPRNSPISPWRQEQLVTCTRLDDSGFDEDGPDAVLPTDGFLWIFPCFILARNHQSDPETGAVLWDKLRFVVPEFELHGERGIAIFTDRHLAEDYRDHMESRYVVEPFEFPTPSALLEFLGWARDRYRRILVDMSREHQRPTLTVAIETVMSEIGRQTDHQDDPGSL